MIKGGAPAVNRHASGRKNRVIPADENFVIPILTLQRE